MVLEVHEEAEPLTLTAASTRFSVRLRQETGRVRFPHVYEIKSPDEELTKIHPPNFCLLHGGGFCNRTMSWVEFGQGAGDIIFIKVTRHDGVPFPRTTRILPYSASVRVDSFADGGRTIFFAVRGAHRHLLLHHGDAPSREPSSSFRHLLMIWVGGLDPSPASLDPHRTLRFGPGVHRLEGAGILQLPRHIDTVVLARGAWVEGRFNVTPSERPNTPLRMLGHGIMDGSRFTYHGTHAADSMRFVEPQYDRPLVWDGPSLINPQGHAAVLPPHSRARAFRMLGWLYNEDGICTRRWAHMTAASSQPHNLSC